MPGKFLSIACVALLVACYLSVGNGTASPNALLLRTLGPQSSGLEGLRSDLQPHAHALREGLVGHWGERWDDETVDVVGRLQLRGGGLKVPAKAKAGAKKTTSAEQAQKANHPHLPPPLRLHNDSVPLPWSHS